MKRLAVFSVAMIIATMTFAQSKSNNPLESELNYKHPFAAAAAKKNQTDKSEKLVAEPATVQNDYKHPNRKQKGSLIKIRRGDYSSATTKHPLG